MKLRPAKDKFTLPTKQRGFLLNPSRFKPAGGGSSGSYKNTMLSLSPTGYYEYENASGTSVLDSSPNARHGTYNSGNNSSNPGLLTVGDGSGRSFNAAAEAGHTVPYSVLSVSANFTIAFIIQYNVTTNKVVMDKGLTNNLSIQTVTSQIALVAGGDSGGSGVVVKSTRTLADNVPHHIVMVLGDTLAKSFVYVDGVDDTTRTAIKTFVNNTVSNFTIGTRGGSLSFGGRIDELAFFDYALTAANVASLYAARTVGDANVLSLMHMEGANLGSVFADEKGYAWSKAGANGSTSTAISKFGSSSYLGATTAAGITTPHNSILAVGASDFTWECNFYALTGGAFQGLASKRSANSQFAGFAVYLGTDNKLNFNVATGATAWAVALTASIATTLNAMHHVAAVRQGVNLYLFLDGTLVASSAALGATALSDNGSPFTIGALSSVSEFSFNGYIDEVRFSNTARYTANFAVPTAPFTL
jgi:hypothetical protein